MISYLLSNVNWEEGFGSTLSRYLLTDVVKSEKIVFIPTSFDDPNKTEKYLRYNVAAFEMMGLAFKDIVVLSLDVDTIEVRNEIESADVIFLMGGDTLSQYNFIRNRDLTDCLRLFEGVMIGISAGAINMCSTSILTLEHPSKDLHVYEGFGVVNLSVEVHFDINSIKQLELLKEATNYVEEIYCITDFSSIRVSGDEVNIIGNDIYKYSENNIVNLM
ncbi:Type 1 glutamine amidotransferase-like domain-containing protein [Mycoplasmatota bacterium WC44]